MSSSPSSFDQICREVRERFPSAFGKLPSPDRGAVEGVDSWVESCLGGAGMQQVCAVPRRSSGSLELLLKLVAETRRRQMRMVWIDPCDCLDPVTAFEVPPRHLLWARGGGLSTAVRVADAVLRDENFPFVCLDGVLLRQEDWRGVPSAQWYRLQRLAHRRGATVVLWTPPVTIPGVGRRWSLSCHWRFPDCFSASGDELRGEVSVLAEEEAAHESAGQRAG